METINIPYPIWINNTMVYALKDKATEDIEYQEQYSKCQIHIKYHIDKKTEEKIVSYTLWDILGEYHGSLIKEMKYVSTEPSIDKAFSGMYKEATEIIDNYEKNPDSFMRNGYKEVKQRYKNYIVYLYTAPDCRHIKYEIYKEDTQHACEDSYKTLVLKGIEEDKTQYDVFRECMEYIDERENSLNKRENSLDGTNKESQTSEDPIIPIGTNKDKTFTLTADITESHIGDIDIETYRGYKIVYNKKEQIVSVYDENKKLICKTNPSNWRYDNVQKSFHGFIDSHREYREECKKNNIDPYNITDLDLLQLEERIGDLISDALFYTDKLNGHTDNHYYQDHMHVCDFELVNFRICKTHKKLEKKVKKECKKYLSSIGEKRDKNLMCCEDCIHNRYVMLSKETPGLVLNISTLLPEKCKGWDNGGKE